MNKLSLLIIIALVSITSCTIQKRQHLPGYHIEWKGSEGERSVFSKERTNESVQTQAMVETGHQEVAEEAMDSTLEVIAPTSHQGNDTFELNEGRTKKNAEEQAHPAVKLTFPTLLHAPVHFLAARALPEVPKKTDGISIAAMVCGILCFFVPYIGIVLAILAIVFGGIGLHRTKNNPDLKGRGMAITGLVLGILGILLVFAIAALIISLLAMQ